MWGHFSHRSLLIPRETLIKSDNDLISVSLATHPRFQTCGGGFAANIYGAMPEGKCIAGFPFEISKH